MVSRNDKTGSEKKKQSLAAIQIMPTHNSILSFVPSFVPNFEPIDSDRHFAE